MEKLEELYFLYYREDGKKRIEYVHRTPIHHQDMDSYYLDLPFVPLYNNEGEYVIVNKKDLMSRNMRPGFHSQFYDNCSKAEHHHILYSQNEILEKLLSKNNPDLNREFLELLVHSNVSLPLKKLARKMRMRHLFSKKYVK